MKKWILSGLIFCLAISATKAQNYTHALGIRLGGSSGIDYKYFCNDNIALNSLLTFQHGGMRVTQMVQAYRPILTGKTDQLFLYGGGGLHVGYVSDARYHHWENEPDRYHVAVRTKASLGLDAIIGLEYRFIKVPVTVGLNYKPSFELISPKYYWWGAGDFGVTARYIFNK